jgi:multicomponent Na+:H+ antiporter subunit B
VKDLVVLQFVARFQLPFALVFGLYLTSHGTLTPGGGLTGGVVIGAAFIVYGLVFGAPKMRRVIPRWFSDLLAAAGLLAFVGVGIYAMVVGYELLDATALEVAHVQDPEAWWTLVAQWAMAATVAGVMLTLFNEITEGTTEPAQPQRAQETGED